MKISLQNISVRYGSHEALSGATLEIASGRLTAVMGRNGSGKSTLLKAICGLVPLAGGTISLGGSAIQESGSRIAYLPQKERLDPGFPVTVRGVVEMGRFPFIGWVRNFSEKDHQAVEDAMTTLHLSDLQDRQIADLSGGQQQRVFIARALAQEAELLLFDEPYTGLDYPSQDNLTDVLRMLAEGRKSLLISHHDLGTVRRHFADVALVNRRIIAHGSVEEALTESNIEEAYKGG